MIDITPKLRKLGFTPKEYRDDKTGKPFIGWCIKH